MGVMKCFGVGYRAKKNKHYGHSYGFHRWTFVIEALSGTLKHKGRH